MKFISGWKLVRSYIWLPWLRYCRSTWHRWMLEFINFTRQRSRNRWVARLKVWECFFPFADNAIPLENSLWRTAKCCKRTPFSLDLLRWQMIESSFSHEVASERRIINQILMSLLSVKANKIPFTLFSFEKHAFFKWEEVTSTLEINTRLNRSHFINNDFRVNRL